jgi:hypothetical protein
MKYIQSLLLAGLLCVPTHVRATSLAEASQCYMGIMNPIKVTLEVIMSVACIKVFKVFLDEHAHQKRAKTLIRPQFDVVRDDENETE